MHDRKIPANGLGAHLGAYVLITDDPHGGPAASEPGPDAIWYPARTRSGALAARVLDVRAASGNRRTVYDVHTNRGVVAGIVPTRSFHLADPSTIEEHDRQMGTPARGGDTVLELDGHFDPNAAADFADRRGLAYTETLTIDYPARADEVASEPAGAP
jgi:hypothetical protein